MGCGSSVQHSSDDTSAPPTDNAEGNSEATKETKPNAQEPPIQPQGLGENQKQEAKDTAKNDCAVIKEVKATEDEAVAPAGESKLHIKKTALRKIRANEVDWSAANPEKWSFPEMKFGGGFSFSSEPDIQEIHGEISEGLKKVNSQPGLYDGIFYQSDMVGWPADQQVYKLVQRNRSGIQMKQDDSGAFTWVRTKYQALPSDVTVEPDAYTDNMTVGGSALGKPLMPGRGMGCADVPNIRLLSDASPNDVIQGGVGDCWLMSAISVLAEFEGAIHKLFKHDDITKLPLDTFNKYRITLYDLPTWELVDVVVDERLCTKPDGNGLQGCQPTLNGELWVCYLEKAVAAHCGGWDKIQGGQPTHAWRFLTGCKENYTFQNDDGSGFGCYGTFNPNTQSWDPLTNSPHGNSGLWPMKWPEVGGGGDLNLKVDKSNLFNRMVLWAENNYMMCAGTKEGSDKESTDGIVDGHAYTILACVKQGEFDLIKVRNPWHSGEFKSGMWDDDGPGWTAHPEIKAALRPVKADDGIFWLSKDEFFDYYKQIYVCAHDMAKFRT